MLLSDGSVPEGVANALDEALEKRGITAVELAARSGISHVTISRLRSGRYEGKLSTLGRLFKALEFELELVAKPEKVP